MRLCHLEESVSRPGRMWPSRTRVTCCMSRQKMEYSNSTARSVCSFRVSFNSSWGAGEGDPGAEGPQHRVMTSHSSPQSPGVPQARTGLWSPRNLLELGFARLGVGEPDNQT